MSKFVFQHIQNIKSIDLHKNVFLWVWHANKIPPHIGVSINGLYFSLKVSGKDESLPVDRVQRIIDEKGIPFLAIEIKGNHGDVVQIFNKYSSAKSGQITCLGPIKEFLEIGETCTKLEELLLVLQSRNQIGKIAGCNLSSEFIQLPDYSKEEINNRLAKLENAQRREYIS